MPFCSTITLYVLCLPILAQTHAFKISVSEIKIIFSTWMNIVNVLFCCEIVFFSVHHELFLELNLCWNLYVSIVQHYNYLCSERHYTTPLMDHHQIKLQFLFTHFMHVISWIDYNLSNITAICLQPVQLV